MAGDIRSNASALTDSWSGNASDAAYSYFTRLSDALDDHREALDSLREQYTNAAWGVSNLATEVQATTNTIMDQLFWIGIEAAASAASAETGVGPVAGGLAIAIQAKTVYDGWNKLIQANSVAQTVVRGGAGQIARILEDGLFHVTPLPTGGYSHPGVS